MIFLDPFWIFCRPVLQKLSEELSFVHRMWVARVLHDNDTWFKDLASYDQLWQGGTKGINTITKLLLIWRTAPGKITHGYWHVTQYYNKVLCLEGNPFCKGVSPPFGNAYFLGLSKLDILGVTKTFCYGLFLGKPRAITFLSEELTYSQQISCIELNSIWSLVWKLVTLKKQVEPNGSSVEPFRIITRMQSIGF